MPSSGASSAAVGSWAQLARELARTARLRCSRSCTWDGSRIVREWFWIARTSACRIHQTAYVENLKPAAMVELSRRPDQPDVPFLDQVREGESEIAVVLRDRHHQLQVVLDEAVLLDREPLVGVLDLGRQLEQADARQVGLDLQLAQPLGPLASPGHLRSDPQDLLAQLRQQAQREVRGLQLADDLGVDALELADRRLLALLPQHAQALDGSRDARGDLPGLLRADGLGELRARVRERTQRVPAVDHVLGGAGDGVERIAQIRSRCLEVLGEDDLFLAAQRARAADLLEIGLERPPLPPRVELVGCDGARGTARGAGRGPAVCDPSGLFKLH